VWFDVLSGDDRSESNPELMPNPRVIHYWDSQRAVAIWFPQQEVYKALTFRPYAWDQYFLYGPEAAWTDVPGPVVRSGRTVLSKRKKLEKALLPLITER
jgi:hypothetical protein